MTEESRQYHVDGEIVPAEEATVSVRDRGFKYGDAAFETLRAYGGEPFEWAAHADRLENTCDRLAIPCPDREDLRERAQATLEANDLEDAYVRLSVTRGVQAGRLTPESDADPTVVILVESLPRGGSEGESVWDGPATLQTVKTRRMPEAAVSPDLKTHNYLNGILARLELAEGVDEALLRDGAGNVAEGATSNLFFVDDRGLHTPEPGDLLPGITRKVVLELARAEPDLPVQTGQYRPGDVRDATEAFLTNTTWEVRPVESVDGIDVGGGPVTELLARLFDDLVERRHY